MPRGSLTKFNSTTYKIEDTHNSQNKMIDRIKFLMFFFFISFFVSLSNGKMLTTVPQSTLMQMDSTRVVSLLEESVNVWGVDFRKAIKLAEEAKEIAIALDHPNLIISSELSLFQRFFIWG